MSFIARRKNIPAPLVWLLPLTALFVLAWLLFNSDNPTISPVVSNKIRAANSSSSGPKEMPSDLAAAYSQALQQDAPVSYSPIYSGLGQYQLNNQSYGLKAGFSNQGLEVNGWKMRLTSYGYSGEVKTSADQLSPLLKDKRVEYHYVSGLTEWYVNSEMGLEQGFTLEKPLSGNSNAELELKLSLTGITAKTGDAAEWLELSDGLRYGKLMAWDSTGRKLTSQLTTTGNEIGLKIDGRGAVYPLTIDPYLQQQILTASDGVSGERFGFGVALSSDGNTALIGAAEKNSGQGAAYVFTRSGFTWVQQQKLTASDGVIGDRFGYSVALITDGNTALIGAREKNGGQGTAYVFTRSGNSWSQQQELAASDGMAGDIFGTSVALSGNGNTALIGAFNKIIGNNSPQGAAYIFTRSGNSWAQQQELTASDGTAFDHFGSSVALSNDSNTALIGAFNKNIGNNSQQGTAYVFTLFGNSWAQQQQFTTSDGAAGDRFGYSVALSGNGNTALIGAYFKNIGFNGAQGAAYVFTRSGITWSQQQQLLISDGSASDYFGQSVALSSDGSTALIGALIASNSSRGAVYVFTRSGNSWTQQQELFALDSVPMDNFGTSVALSSDGKTALIGAYRRNSYQGAAYVFFARYNTSTTMAYQPPGNPKVGQPITLNATITGATGTYTPTGTVTFNLNNSPAVTALLSAPGLATTPFTFQAPGIYMINATYSGDALFNGSTSLSQRVIVDPNSSLIVTSITDNGTGLTNGTLSKAISNTVSGGAITFQLTSGNTITVTGKLPDVKAGTFIDGSCSNPITILGTGVNSTGLVLKGNVTLVGLIVQGFNGIQITNSGTGNKVACVKAIR